MTQDAPNYATSKSPSLAHEYGSDDRFHCDSPERPKKKGKLLKKELYAHGHDIPLSKCQELVAKMYGFRNFNDLYDQVGLFGRSLGDEDVDQATFDQRFWRQVDKLMDIGVSPDDAEEIIDRVRPTGIHISKNLHSMSEKS
jgi:hypothetical protein